eukprot:105617-Heterocapsa_arctica.AAC.1
MRCAPHMRPGPNASMCLRPQSYNTRPAPHPWWDRHGACKLYIAEASSYTAKGCDTFHTRK